MKQLALTLKALADEKRLKIMSLLTEREMCVCEIIDDLQISQSAVSHHLKILKNADLVTDSRQGKWIFYNINLEAMTKLESKLKENLFAVLEKGEAELKKSPIRNDCQVCEQIMEKNRHLEED